ncbi:nucleotidyltransferase family protein [Spirochaeta isovalerica]|uniref:NDP-sugar pyrophosphorylase family protein n=1 Tax=Spirochaeta isovalerica TaxID=150 RepID=A0A841R4C5_9SPIO|nr:sugar phosphate nucleotidyltransferase [Spirochaeta isovalerica]MBB6478653.1 NDP-sugar pyrophosphorylase family protein [Spirochaeta isovalerica]
MKPVLVVMAAGMGSRYGGIKQIEPVGPNGEAIIDYSIYDAVRSGFSEVVFIIRKAIEEDFKKYIGSRFADKIKVTYCFQQLDSQLPDGFVIPEGREKPWGTGQAVLCARDVVNAPFVVINADDFYGSDAFAKTAEYLREIPSDSMEFAMAGYPIVNTLSDYGSVSRGICAVDENLFLSSIEEHVKISREGNRIVSRQPGEPELELTGSETVSMNFWCLTPKVFDYLDTYFKDFLKEKGRELKSEIYLPIVLGDMSDKGDCSVKVIKTESDWFGVTYKEDKPLVVESISGLIKSGVYPSPLWK